MRHLRPEWLAALLLPLPALLMLDSATNSEAACVYLGIASAWLAGEAATRDTSALPAIAINFAVFIALGTCVGVKSQIPFPLLATLSIIPAAMIPSLTRRLGDPWRAMLAVAVILLVAKIAACGVARIAYGPNFIEAGYVSADWRQAKLMITTFWSLTAAASVAIALGGRALMRNPTLGTRA